MASFTLQIYSVQIFYFQVFPEISADMNIILLLTILVVCTMEAMGKDGMCVAFVYDKYKMNIFNIWIENVSWAVGMF